MVYRDNTCDMESHILASGHTEKRHVYTCNCIKEIHFASLLKNLLVLQKKKIITLFNGDQTVLVPWHCGTTNPTHCCWSSNGPPAYLPLGFVSSPLGADCSILRPLQPIPIASWSQFEDKSSSHSFCLLIDCGGPFWLASSTVAVLNAPNPASYTLRTCSMSKADSIVLSRCLTLAALNWTPTLNFNLHLAAQPSMKGV